ncbi:hypothetical protein BJ742DRAFT_439287 [Cladochytrium replicatum]|nr:hypothetical protein BJ742DRAFT_439287 [Cladochytrium replicatum]
MLDLWRRAVVKALAAQLSQVETTMQWSVCGTELHTELQTGPTCGLIALLIARKHYNRISAPSLMNVPDSLYSIDGPVTLTAMLALAKSAGFTQHGELFSAYDIAKLASHWCGMQAKVVPWDEKTEDRSVDNVTSHLLTGGLALIPYDRDKNNEPALKRGHSAHWCIANGLIFLSEGSSGEEQSGSLDVRVIEHERWTDSRNNPSFALCVHGKSLHQAVWRYDSLRRSNANLIEVSQKVAQGKYCIPENGDLSGTLRGLVVLLSH